MSTQKVEKQYTRESAERVLESITRDQRARVDELDVLISAIPWDCLTKVEEEVLRRLFSRMRRSQFRGW